MADATITVQGIILKDNWPAVNCVTEPDVANIADMTSTLVGHNQGTAKYQLGTKWQLYNRGDAVSIGVGYHRGWSRFIYLKAEPTATTAIACTTLMLVVPDSTMVAGMAHDALYTVTADSDRTTHDTHGVVAVALSTMTNSYYGWYWCGGVCPVEFVPGFLTASLLQTDDTPYSASTVTEITTFATAATEIGLRAQPTGAVNMGCGEAVYVKGT